jgi:hypothetical protein
MGLKAKIDASLGGYVRVRKRKLTGGFGATTSTSYELVRPGEPYHKSVFGLGSLKQHVRHESDIAAFWLTAFARMRRHGLDEHQRRHVAATGRLAFLGEPDSQPRPCTPSTGR